MPFPLLADAGSYNPNTFNGDASAPGGCWLHGTASDRRSEAAR